MATSETGNAAAGNSFSSSEWSAPYCETPQELMERVDQLNLIGRTVEDIKVIGIGFNWTISHFDEYVEGELNSMDPLLRERIPDSDDLLPHGVLLDRFSEIDKPVLLLLDGGDVLAIDYHWGSSVRIDVNSIPFDSKTGRDSNFHANRLFREILGKKIADIEIGMTKSRPEFGNPGQSYYIASLTLVFSSDDHYKKEWGGSARKLRFEAWIDYGYITMLDEYDKAVKIAAEEVPEIVEGLGDLEEEIEWEKHRKAQAVRENNTDITADK